MSEIKITYTANRGGIEGVTMEMNAKITASDTHLAHAMIGIAPYFAELAEVAEADPSMTAHMVAQLDAESFEGKPEGVIEEVFQTLLSRGALSMTLRAGSN